MARRDDVITEATALLRDSGPDALTSVNVAAQLGVTQSAIYRHIRDMDELTTIASNAVIAELGTVMIAAVASPETTWGTGTHVAHFAERIVALIGEHQQAFAVIDRWRYQNGELGTGISYWLNIVTSNGEVYESETEMFPSPSPAIDSGKSESFSNAP